MDVVRVAYCVWELASAARVPLLLSRLMNTQRDDGCRCSRPATVEVVRCSQLSRDGHALRNDPRCATGGFYAAWEVQEWDSALSVRSQSVA